MKQGKLNRIGKQILLVVLGFLPAAGGGLFNWYIMHNGSTRYFNLIAVGFLVLWGLLAFAVRPLARSTKEAVLLLHIAATIDLLLVVIQEFILGAYWFNWVGLWTQNFFLLPLPISSTLAFWAHRMLPSYLVSFALMLLVSWFGASRSEG